MKAYQNPKLTRGKNIFVIKAQYTLEDLVRAISTEETPMLASVGGGTLVPYKTPISIWSSPGAWVLYAPEKLVDISKDLN